MTAREVLEFLEGAGRLVMPAVTLAVLWAVFGVTTNGVGALALLVGLVGSMLVGYAWAARFLNNRP